MLTLEQRNLWCEALRSGCYKRIVGEMHGGGGHCALGLGMHVLGIFDEREFESMIGLKALSHIAMMNDALEGFWDEAPYFCYSWSQIANWIGMHVPCANEHRNFNGHEFVEISRDENSVTLAQISHYKYLLDQIDWSTVVIELPKQSETYTGLCKVLDQFKADIAEICT
jgi:hypothetical protein